MCTAIGIYGHHDAPSSRRRRPSTDAATGSRRGRSAGAPASRAKSAVYPAMLEHLSISPKDNPGAGLEELAADEMLRCEQRKGMNLASVKEKEPGGCVPV